MNMTLLSSYDINLHADLNVNIIKTEESQVIWYWNSVVITSTILEARRTSKKKVIRFNNMFMLFRSYSDPN